MDGNINSARTSLISSVDSCYTSDSTNFSRWLAAAAAAGSVSGASLSGERLQAPPPTVASIQNANTDPNPTFILAFSQYSLCLLSLIFFST